MTASVTPRSPAVLAVPAVAAVAAGLYVAGADQAPGAAVTGLLLMVTGVVRAIGLAGTGRTNRRQRPPVSRSTTTAYSPDGHMRHTRT